MNLDEHIISPMATGCGAHVLHKMIETHVAGYRVIDYSPWLTLLPFMLPKVTAGMDCRLIHTAPDYGIFFHRPKVPLLLTIYHYMCDAQIRPYSSLLQQTHYATDLKWFIRKSIEKCTVLTSISQYSARHTQRELNLTRDIQVIYCGVDEKRFCPAKTRRQSPVVRVLFSGNLTRRKGAQWLPDIGAGLDRGIVVQYTSGLRRTQLLPKALNLIDLGRVAWGGMPELYRSSDILVSPTVREGFGLSIAEAMACGLPVVASNCSAVPELIDDGKGGFLCPVGDVRAFAEKINVLAANPELRRQMGEYNRTKVEKMFTLKRMVSEYRQLFESLI
jgi:L-malate glycosyltransferase